MFLYFGYYYIKVGGENKRDLCFGVWNFEWILGFMIDIKA